MAGGDMGAVSGTAALGVFVGGYHDGYVGCTRWLATSIKRNGSPA
jgi:hypothetical protein